MARAKFGAYAFAKYGAFGGHTVFGRYGAFSRSSVFGRSRRFDQSSCGGPSNPVVPPDPGVAAVNGNGCGYSACVTAPDPGEMGSMANGVFQDPIWPAAAGTVDGAGYIEAGVGALVSAPVAGTAVYSGSINVAAAAETYGVPVTAGATWTINNWDNIDNATSILQWIGDQF
jgi:hypothetical protein